MAYFNHYVLTDRELANRSAPADDVNCVVVSNVEFGCSSQGTWALLYHGRTVVHADGWPEECYSSCGHFGLWQWWLVVAGLVMIWVLSWRWALSFWQVCWSCLGQATNSVGRPFSSPSLMPTILMLSLQERPSKPFRSEKSATCSLHVTSVVMQWSAVERAMSSPPMWFGFVVVFFEGKTDIFQLNWGVPPLTSSNHPQV